MSFRIKKSAIIHGTRQIMQPLSWQEQISQAIRCPNELLEYVGLEANTIGYSEKSIKQFPVRVPYAFADRIKQSDPNDPLLRQVFPYRDEETPVKGYVNDPLAETNVQPVQGILHKYKSRVLSVTTGACAIHCRYCFRRHFPYQESSALGQYWQRGLEYIENDTSIDEVILSGGDPLSLSDRRLFEICDSLANIEHIKRIRFHSRIPVVLPDRLTEKLIKKIVSYGRTIVFVLHINHANEIDDAVTKNIRLLQSHNVLVLNQSVLLRGINDSSKTLLQLSEKLVNINVVPYYLHLLDPVAGAAHFDVSMSIAQDLIKQMQASASGYLIPKLVKEEIGGVSKMALTN